jgi:polyisoprenoid-binding protein YceI
MKTLHVTTIALTGLLASSAAFASDWELDPAHTTAQFSVKHMIFTTARGTFDKVSGNVSLDEKDLTRSHVDILIDAASINTHEPKRDEHLRSPDFFDLARTPNITFKSTRIEKAGKGKFKVTGDLTMHGVTKPVVLSVDGPTPEVKSPWGKLIRSVVATGKISRKEWGLNWNKALETGGVVVGDEVQLEVDAELTQKAPATTAAK